jgi:hypothetical protein
MPLSEVWATLGQQPAVVGKQMAEQTGPSGRYPNRFPKGVSGNPRGRPSYAQRKAMVLAKAHEYGASVGGFANLPVIEQDLLLQAAQMSLTHPHRHEARIKQANILNRILRDIQLRRIYATRQINPLRQRSRLNDYLRQETA